jgi:broad specificity polyphosphatase/5'/3'-nucleotidase SurE
VRECHHGHSSLDQDLILENHSNTGKQKSNIAAPQKVYKARRTRSATWQNNSNRRKGILKKCARGKNKTTRLIVMNVPTSNYKFMKRELHTPAGGFKKKQMRLRRRHSLPDRIKKNTLWFHRSKTFKGRVTDHIFRQCPSSNSGKGSEG